MNKSFKLVKGGMLDEQGIKKHFEKPTLYPGVNVARNIRNKLSDLEAQIDAHQRRNMLFNRR